MYNININLLFKIIMANIESSPEYIGEHPEIESVEELTTRLKKINENIHIEKTKTKNILEITLLGAIKLTYDSEAEAGSRLTIYNIDFTNDDLKKITIPEKEVLDIIQKIKYEVEK
ncbi:TPA: hypothetical protein DCQ85_04160 [Candidatus Magasanikbacteria bacterium]|nr:MAG: hypothetical protein A2507_01920 [Candidatus Magasanikbacteria bacterium RIFOXYD12_FULL_33_17]HAO52630.1 hypothetical protein [Candidatus Magasanikbacteria bacterium]